MLLLAGCRLGHSAQFHQDFLLAENQVLLVMNFDVVAGVFAKQDPVAHLYVERDTTALFHLAGPYRDYFTFITRTSDLKLLDRRCYFLPDADLAIPLSFTRISSSRRIRYSWS